jgi:PhnB protein
MASPEGRAKPRVTVDPLSEEETHMARTSTYLNFKRSTEEAFNFYKSVFGTEFVGEIARFGDIPTQEDQPSMSDDDKQLVMNVQLPILGGHLLMGTDAPESMGFQLNQGNNVYICLDPDTRAEADALFSALSAGGKVEQPMQEMFWGDYFGSLVDRFGVQWMINCTAR